MKCDQQCLALGRQHRPEQRGRNQSPGPRNRAVEAGATLDRALADQPYGYRNGGFVDPFGHVWFVATPIAEASELTT